MWNMRKKFIGAWTVATIVGVSVFLAPAPAKATWAPDIPNAIVTNLLKDISETKTALATQFAQTAALNALNSQVDQMMGGRGGVSPIISNWTEVLTAEPQKIANTYVNDMLSQTFRGMGSSANYTAASSGGNLTSGNYVRDLQQQAAAAINVSTPQYTLNQYTSNPDQMFAEGDWRGFNALISNPANNPYGIALLAQDAYQAKLAQATTEAAVKSQSSGFRGVEDANGNIVTPPAAVEGIYNAVKTSGVATITSATRPEQVIGAIANRMVNAAFTRVMATAQGAIQKQVSAVNSQVAAALGPAAKYAPDISQQTNVMMRQGAKLLFPTNK